MIMAYPKESEVFGSACEQFQALVSMLIGEVVRQMTDLLAMSVDQKGMVMRKVAEESARSPEEIVGPCSDQEKSVRPGATPNRVWASVEREQEDVIQDLFDEALRRDPEKKRPWAILVDGGEKQLDLVLGLIRRYRSDASVNPGFHPCSGIPVEGGLWLPSRWEC
jgi:hypothetical protein